MKVASVDAVLGSSGVIGVERQPSSAFRGALEPLRARRYTNGALGDRTVVRLVQTRVTAAEDASLAVLGFVAGTAPVVGQALRRAVGFPAAAIAREPSLAKFALEITKDFQREARRIKSKPGHAMQGFTKLADELGRSVPAFLPSFWEEAARAFMANAAPDQAGQCFGKARTAEEVHGLEVDEDERHQAFLELALAGGLPIGALGDYAKALEKRYPPREAYQRFRALCRERTLGGLPPWGGMVKELSRLAKAAKLDVAAEETTLLRELLASPAIGKAPPAFWDAVEKTLGAMVTAEPALAARMLELEPKVPHHKNGVAERWLELLQSIGAIDALVAGTPPEAQPRDGAAGVIGRLVALGDQGYGSTPPSGLVTLLDQLAPRILREGTPLRLWYQWAQTWDLDLLERALALGLPIAERTSPYPHATQFNLATWASGAERPGRGLDPVLVAADLRFAKPFAEAIGQALRVPHFQSASVGKRGFLEGKRVYFRALVSAAERGGNYAASALLEGLRHVLRPGTFDDLPEVHAELARLDLTGALTRTLRAGLLDELVWPAWEAAVARLGPNARTLGPFPHPIVADTKTALVVGRDGVVFEHDLRLPQHREPHAARFVGGDLVVLYQTGTQASIYWASDPTTHVDVTADYWPSNLDRIGAVLPDGTWTEGGRAMARGDTRWPERGHLVNDGHTLWSAKQETKTTLRELDPKTGARGRESLPAFFAAQVTPDTSVAVASSTLFPIDAPASPLGTKDGLAGFCMRHTKLGLVATGIDGRMMVGLTTTSFPAAGLLTFPGRSDPLRVGRIVHDHGSNIMVQDAKGTVLAMFTPGIPATHWQPDPYPSVSRALQLMPFATWHYLRPRDAAASAKLRKIGEDAVRALVRAVERVDTKVATEQAVVATLGIHEPVLVQMIATRARQTVALANELRDLLARAEPSATKPTKDLQLSALREPLQPFADVGWGVDSFGAMLVTLARAFAEPETFKPVGQGSHQALFELLGRDAALIALAASPGFEPHRDILLDLYEAMRAVKLPSAARVRSRRIDGKSLLSVVPSHTLLTRARTVYFAPPYYEMSSARLYEVALDGTFATLPIGAEHELEYPKGPDWGDDAAEVVRTRGTLAWRPEIGHALAAATGLSYAEAALVWLGFPGFAKYDKNFLAKELRELLGLKVDQAKAARDSLTARLIHGDTRLAFLLETLPARAALLWDESARIAHIAAAWNRRFGRRAPIDEQLVGLAKKDIGAIGLEPTEAFAFFADASVEPKVFEREALRGAVGYTSWLFHELPVGHALRAGIPAALAAVRARLAKPGFTVSWGHLTYYSADWEKDARAAMAALGGMPIASKDPKVVEVDLGAVRARWSGQPFIELALVPARLGDAHTAELLQSFAGKIHAKGDIGVVLEAARSDALTALAERVTTTPVADGGYETNPLASVPALVEEVAETLSLGRDAAAYYLQLMVLPNPSDARIKALNGWSSAELAAAADGLVARELAIDAKRARAGRDVFLPGGWVDLKAPYPSMELWKLGFFGHTKHDGVGFETTFGQVLLLEPAHLLFARAWDLVKAGKGPRYEEAGESRKKTKKKGAT